VTGEDEARRWLDGSIESKAEVVGNNPVVEPGQVWLRKRSSSALVRQVRAVENSKVHYEVLHGPVSLRRKPRGVCSVRSFIQDARTIEEQPDYAHLDGAKQYGTFLVLRTDGTPLLRCSQKRADFYQK
jgi:hypothetical protein